MVSSCCLGVTLILLLWIEKSIATACPPSAPFIINGGMCTEPLLYDNCFFQSFELLSATSQCNITFRSCAMFTAAINSGTGFYLLFDSCNFVGQALATINPGAVIQRSTIKFIGTTLKTVAALNARFLDTTNISIEMSTMLLSSSDHESPVRFLGTSFESHSALLMNNVVFSGTSLATYAVQFLGTSFSGANLVFERLIVDRTTTGFKVGIVDLHFSPLTASSLSFKNGDITIANSGSGSLTLVAGVWPQDGSIIEFESNIITLVAAGGGITLIELPGLSDVDAGTELRQFAISSKSDVITLKSTSTLQFSFAIANFFFPADAIEVRLEQSIVQLESVAGSIDFFYFGDQVAHSVFNFSGCSISLNSPVTSNMFHLVSAVVDSHWYVVASDISQFGAQTAFLSQTSGSTLQVCGFTFQDSVFNLTSQLVVLFDIQMCLQSNIVINSTSIVLGTESARGNVFFLKVGANLVATIGTLENSSLALVSYNESQDEQIVQMGSLMVSSDSAVVQHSFFYAQNSNISWMMPSGTCVGFSLKSVDFEVRLSGVQLEAESRSYQLISFSSLATQTKIVLEDITARIFSKSATDAVVAFDVVIFDPGALSDIVVNISRSNISFMSSEEVRIIGAVAPHPFPSRISKWTFLIYNTTLILSGKKYCAVAQIQALYQIDELVLQVNCSEITLQSEEMEMPLHGFLIAHTSLDNSKLALASSKVQLLSGNVTGDAFLIAISDNSHISHSEILVGAQIDRSEDFGEVTIFDLSGGSTSVSSSSLSFNDIVAFRTNLFVFEGRIESTEICATHISVSVNQSRLHNPPGKICVFCVFPSSDINDVIFNVTDMNVTVGTEPQRSSGEDDLSTTSMLFLFESGFRPVYLLGLHIAIHNSMMRFVGMHTSLLQFGPYVEGKRVEFASTLANNVMLLSGKGSSYLFDFSRNVVANCVMNGSTLSILSERTVALVSGEVLTLSLTQANNTIVLNGSEFGNVSYVNVSHADKLVFSSLNENISVLGRNIGFVTMEEVDFSSTTVAHLNFTVVGGCANGIFCESSKKVSESSGKFDFACSSSTVTLDCEVSPVVLNLVEGTQNSNDPSEILFQDNQFLLSKSSDVIFVNVSSPVRRGVSIELIRNNLTTASSMTYSYLGIANPVTCATALAECNYINDRLSFNFGKLRPTARVCLPTRTLSTSPSRSVLPSASTTITPPPTPSRSNIGSPSVSQQQTSTNSLTRLKTESQSSSATPTSLTTSTISATRTPPPTPSVSKAATKSGSLNSTETATISPPPTPTTNITASLTKTPSKSRSITISQQSNSPSKTTTYISTTSESTSLSNTSDTTSTLEGSVTIEVTTTETLPSVTISARETLTDTLAQSHSTTLRGTDTLTETFNTTLTISSSLPGTFTAVATMSATESFTITPSQTTTMVSTMSESLVDSNTATKISTVTVTETAVLSDTVSGMMAPTLSATPTRSCIPAVMLGAAPSVADAFRVYQDGGLNVTWNISQSLIDESILLQYVKVSWGSARRATLSNFGRSSKFWIVNPSVFVLTEEHVVQVVVSRGGLRCDTAHWPFNSSVTIQPVWTPSSVVFRSVTSALGIVSSAAASPSVAVAQARASMLMELSLCKFSHSAPLPFSLSPLRLSFGDPVGAFYRGAVVGNLLILLLLGIVSYVVVFVLYSRNEDLTTLQEAAASVKLPGLFVVPFAILLQAITSVSLSCGLHGNGPGDVFLSILGFVSMTSGIGWCTVMVTSFFQATPMSKSQELPPWKYALLRLQFKRTVWVDRNGGDHQQEEDEFSWTRAHQALFQSYRPGAQWFIIFELSLCFIYGILEGARPSSEGGCSTVFVLVFILSLVSWPFALIFKPHAALISRWFFTGTTMLTTLLSLCLLINSQSSRTFVDIFAFLFVGCGIATIIVKHTARCQRQPAVDPTVLVPFLPKEERGKSAPEDENRSILPVFGPIGDAVAASPDPVDPLSKPRRSFDGGCVTPVALTETLEPPQRGKKTKPRKRLKKKSRRTVASLLEDDANLDDELHGLEEELSLIEQLPAAMLQHREEGQKEEDEDEKLMSTFYANSNLSGGITADNVENV